MNINRHIHLAVMLGAAGLATLTGCSNNPGSTAAANNMQMLRVLNTTVVGKPVWVSPPDSAAIVEMKSTPLPANYVLVGLDKNHQITAVLLTTKYARHNYQGFMLLSGSLGENDDVALPGSEYEVAVADDIKNYQEQRTNPNPKQETAGAAPASTTSATQQPTAAPPTI